MIDDLKILEDSEGEVLDTSMVESDAKRKCQKLCLPDFPLFGLRKLSLTTQKCKCFSFSEVAKTIG